MICHLSISAWARCLLRLALGLGRRIRGVPLCIVRRVLPIVRILISGRGIMILWLVWLVRRLPSGLGEGLDIGMSWRWGLHIPMWCFGGEDLMLDVIKTQNKLFYNREADL